MTMCKICSNADMVTGLYAPRGVEMAHEGPVAREKGKTLNLISAAARRPCTSTFIYLTSHIVYVL